MNNTERFNTVIEWSILLVAFFGPAMTLCAANNSSAAKLDDAVRNLPAEFERPAERVTSALYKYVEEERRLFSQFHRQLNKEIDKIQKNKKLDAAHATEYLNQLEQALVWLEKGEKLPAGDLTLSMIVDFASQVSSNRAKLINQVNRLAKKLNRADYSRSAAQILELAGKVGGRFNAQNIVSAGTLCRGYRIHGGNPKNLQFRFGNVTGTRFSGKVERDWNYRGHPVHELNGKLDGISFQATTGRSLAYGSSIDNMWNYEGIVVGNYIIGRYFGTTRKGKQHADLFRVEIKK